METELRREILAVTGRQGKVAIADSCQILDCQGRTGLIVDGDRVKLRNVNVAPRKNKRTQETQASYAVKIETISLP
jgi:hypothetical protein